MLAQIVTEIHAPDLAAGDVGGAGVVAESNDGDAIFGSAHRHARVHGVLEYNYNILKST